MRKLIKIFSVLTLSYYLIGTSPVMAQCPMCKAAVISEHGGGESELAKGLNTGILYMFVLPYAVITVVGVLWYRGYKKKKKQEEEDNDENTSGNN